MDYTYFLGSLDQVTWPIITKPDLVLLGGTTLNGLQSDLMSALKEVIPSFIKAFYDSTRMSPTFGCTLLPASPSSKPVEIKFAEKKWELCHWIMVENIDKMKFMGSVVAQAFYKKNGEYYFIGQRAILSRWDTSSKCANCKTNQKSSVSIYANHHIRSCMDDPLTDIRVELVCKDPVAKNPSSSTVKVCSTKVSTTYASNDIPTFCLITSLSQQPFP